MMKLEFHGYQILLPHQRTAEDNDIPKIQEAFKDVFGTEKGAKVLSYLMSQTKTTYAMGDSHHSAYRQGQRAVVDWIVAFISQTPHDIAELLRQQENQNG